MQRIEQLDATDMLSGMAQGVFGAEEIVRACLDRIASREASVKAFAHVGADQALTAAREADKLRLATRQASGPLDGIPVAFKDVIATGDMPTRFNSPLFSGAEPCADASVVGLMRTAGAILLGKTETVEFAAHGRNALTRNPHDLTRTPGGSSSGSAAAVADFMVPIAFGTQTGGSLIRPASYCGVFGFKPTHGLVSGEGMKTFSPTLDTLGWYARSLADIRLVAKTLGLSEELRSRAPKAHITFGLYKTAYWDQADPEAKAALLHAGEVLRGVGTVVDFEPGPEFDDLDGLKLAIMQGEGWSNFLELYRRFGSRTSPGIQKRMGTPDWPAVRGALDTAATLRPLFEDRMAGLDVIITLAAPGVATAGIESTGSPIFNSLWTLLHMPCLSVPVMKGSSGLPIGLQLVGRRYEDTDMLDIAARCLDAFDKD